MHIENFQTFLTGVLNDDVSFMEKWDYYAELNIFDKDQLQYTLTEIEKILTDKTHPHYSNALYLRGKIFLNGLEGSPDIPLAIKYLNEAIALQNGHALNCRGLMYQRGIGCKVNPVKAFAYCQKAAKLGNFFGINNLAWLYQEGLGTVRDMNLAILNYEEAIKLGSLAATFNLAIVYEKGTGGVPVNLAKALELLDLAAAKDHPIALDYRAGLYHQKGMQRQAFKLVEKSAELSFPPAITHLGLHYLNGWGCPVDRAKAQELFKRARALNEPEALNIPIEASDSGLPNPTINKSIDLIYRMFRRKLVISRLEDKIKDLEDYGAELSRLKVGKSYVIRSLNRNLTKELDAFINYVVAHSATNEVINHFTSAMYGILSQQEEELQEHREIWKPVVGNIAIALTGIGLIILLIKIYLQEEPFSFNRSLFFARTFSEQCSDEIKTALSDITCESLTVGVR